MPSRPILAALALTASVVACNSPDPKPVEGKPVDEQADYPKAKVSPKLEDPFKEGAGGKVSPDLQDPFKKEAGGQVNPALVDPAKQAEPAPGTAEPAAEPAAAAEPAPAGTEAAPEGGRKVSPDLSDPFKK